MTPEKLGTLLSLPRLADDIAAVERRLDGVVKQASPGLRRPMLRLVRAGGKRLRPILVIAAASSEGGKTSPSVITAAAAIELTHLSSLIHDDIMDEAELRGGQPTISHQEGLATALMAGDFLLAMAAAEAAKVDQVVAAEVSQTIASMADGQHREVAERHRLDRSVNAYTRAVRQKTASLFGASCTVGAIAAGLSQRQQQQLAAYGLALGMAFQLTDDLLDITSTVQLLGKPVGTDMAEGNFTYPLLLGLAGPQRPQLEALLRAKPLDQTAITRKLTAGGSIAATIQEIERYNQRAVAAVRQIHASSVIDGLRQLPEVYWQSALAKMVML